MISLIGIRDTGDQQVKRIVCEDELKLEFEGNNLRLKNREIFIHKKLNIPVAHFNGQYYMRWGTW